MLQEISFTSAGSLKTHLYDTLLRLRPAQLGDLIKTALRIRRCYIQTGTGQIFWADPVSVFGLQLIREGVYEAQMTSLFQTVLRPRDVVLDIGGNEGYFSVLADSLAPGGVVHCVEPQSRLQQVIQRNILANQARSVVVHRLALSSAEGEIQLFLRPSTNTGASSFSRHWRIGSACETVRAIKLDSFFEEHHLQTVRLMKVDCEGAEALIVRGGVNVLKEHSIEFIAMEYHPAICGRQACLDTHSTVLQAGYILTKIGGQFVYHLPGLDSQLEPLGDRRQTTEWDA